MLVATTPVPATLSPPQFAAQCYRSHKTLYSPSRNADSKDPACVFYLCRIFISFFPRFVNLFVCVTFRSYAASRCATTTAWVVLFPAVNRTRTGKDLAGMFSCSLDLVAKQSANADGWLLLCSQVPVCWPCRFADAFHAANWQPFVRHRRRRVRSLCPLSCFFFSCVLREKNIHKRTGVQIPDAGAPSPSGRRCGKDSVLGIQRAAMLPTEHGASCCVRRLLPLQSGCASKFATLAFY